MRCIIKAYNVEMKITVNNRIKENWVRMIFRKIITALRAFVVVNAHIIFVEFQSFRFIVIF